MRTKITQEEIICQFKKAHGDRYDYSRVIYTGIQNPVIIICKEHGEFIQTPDNHKRGKGCKKCGSISMWENRNDKVDILQLTDDILRINGNIEILNIFKSNNHTMVNCRCLVDGHIWDTRSYHLLNGHGCPKCSATKKTGLFKLNIDIIKNKLLHINSNIEILNNEYLGYRQKIKAKCLIESCGYEWETTWEALSQGGSCRKCSTKNFYDKRRPSITHIRNRLLLINKNIKILSNTFTRTNDKLHCECKICGEKWFASWKHIKRGSGCPSCSKGWLIKGRAERNKDKWENIDAFVYLIECYNQNEYFYKIGIARYGAKNRFKTKQSMPYDYNIINEIPINLYDAVYLEDILHYKNKEFKYAPKILFKGHTECFSEIKIFDNILENTPT